MLTGPLSSGLPLLTDSRVSDGKRRFNPYGPKKRRGKANQSDSTSPIDRQGNALPSPATPTSSQAGPPPTPQGYPDQSPVSSIPPHPNYTPYPLPPNYYGPPGYAGPPPPSYVDLPCPSTSPSAQHPQQGPPAHQQYGYPGYNNPPPADHAQRQGLVPSPQQGFYPYYPPPPHPPYGGYPNTWQAYGNYPPQGPPPTGASAEHPEKPSEGAAEPSSSPNTS